MKTSRMTKSLRAILGLTVIFSMTSSVFAQGGGGFTATPLTPDNTVEAPKPEPSSATQRAAAATGQAGDELVSVFVKLDEASLVSYKGDVPGLPATSPSATGADAIDLNAPASQLYLDYLEVQQESFIATAKQSLAGARVVHRYDLILGGVSMVLPASQVEALSQLPGVLGVYPDGLEQLDTYRTPAFIGAPTTWNKLGGQGSAGEGVIVGIFDSGIWPENAAFSDPDPLGKPYAAPPPAPGNPGGTRTCDFSSGPNPGAPFACNNKLIGAYRFMATYELFSGLIPEEFTSARDDDGHGTHTASTSAGNRGVKVTVNGYEQVLSGVAPRAHIIAYKVCGLEGCYNTDRVAAAQQAIKDGVDVINHSIGGGTTPYSENVSLAFLEAYEAGIFVSWSAGNSGPTPESVAARAPWVASVAATTSDRSFLSTASLVGGSGNLSLTGVSSGAGLSTPAGVVDAAAAPYSNPLCQAPAAPGAFAGKIVICRRGVNARTDKSANVAAGGAVGMFLINTSPSSQDADFHSIPTIHFQNTDGVTLLNYLAANPGATATFTAAQPGAFPGDVVAGFSSRGGPNQTLGVSKPDLGAPGVNVLAGYTENQYGTPLLSYSFLSGTSMAAPHVAGAAALLMDLYPDWTPGQIKSALMTSAKAGLVKEDGVTPATPFDTGSGRVDLRNAWNPGLTFDESGADYLALENRLWDANYPSLYVPVMAGLITVQRQAKEVSGYDSTYRSSVQYPAGQPRDFRVIAPSSFFIPANGEYTINLTVDARDVPLNAVRHATVIFRETNGCVVRFPVTIVRRQPVVTMTKNCDPATLAKGGTANCSITVANTTNNDATINVVDNLPRQIEIVPGSVVNATEESWSKLSFSGVLQGAEPANVGIQADPGGSPAGYLPLSAFGIAPVAGVGDETITNFNVPAFRFGGVTYTRIGFGSNGYAVVGGSTSAADIQFINQSLPNAARPNNVLAPFWTDLNPAAGGAMRIGTLTDGVSTWLILDWQGVREFSTTRTASFQIWILLGATEGIHFTYGTLQGNGDGGFLTVGAENNAGNRGQNYYFDGVGTLPTADTELRVVTAPGVPGETRTITFQVKGVRTGKWVNYAEMTGDLWAGTNIARFAGEVVNP